MDRLIQLQLDITKSSVGILMNGVNNQNTMGSGVARAYYQRWPQVKSSYHNAYEGVTKPKLGMVQLVHIHEVLKVMNAWTQEYYGRDGKQYADPLAIYTCFKKALIYGMEHGLNIYTPRIGCGLGGLDWKRDVEPMLYRALESSALEKVENLTIVKTDMNQFMPKIYVCNL